jgi:hypothetical protein
MPTSDKKTAYPNFEQYIDIPAHHDTNKWLAAVRELYSKKKNGMSYPHAVRQVTSGWKKTEVYDFLNWLKFYEEGSHMKYKFAQVWYENDQPGYFLHIKPDPVAPVQPAVDENAVNEARETAERDEEKRNVIEKQRQKIIGRLDSAEKLLRSQEGQMFAGQELENLMEAIYGLKKKVQLVNKISVATRLYEDMIVREANILGRKGFTKAAAMLYSVAQTPGAAGEAAKGTGQILGNAIPEATPPDDPSGAGHPGAPGGLPATVPGVPDVNTPVGQDQNKDQPTAASLVAPATPPGTAETSPAVVPQAEPQTKRITEFTQNMNEGNKTDETVADDDQLEVEDPETTLMVTEAQMIDEPMTTTPTPDRAPPSPVVPKLAPTDPKGPKAPKGVTVEPLEVSEDDIAPQGDQKELPDTSNFDNQIDNAFKDVTIADVVAKLEVISTYYKTREHPRQLSVVDMMLDSLGLASLFPSLSEALNKSLEANNYISTRVDDILSKLRGAMASKDSGPEVPKTERTDMSGIRNKLQGDQNKEKQRKQMRKEQEDAELTGPTKETPEVEIGEDLGAKPPTPAAPVQTPTRGPVVPRPFG